MRVASVALVLLVAVQCSGKGVKAKRKKRRKAARGPREEIAFAPPDVTEEEAGRGSGVPAKYSCAACDAVVFQLGAAFTAAEAAALPSTTPLSESAAIEAVEQACGRPSFNEYGLKGVDAATRARLGVDKKVLSGPGTLGASIAGLVAGGGAWPMRLSALCWHLVESLEEGELTLRRDWERSSQQFEPSLRCDTCERRRTTSQASGIASGKPNARVGGTGLGPTSTPTQFPQPNIAAVKKTETLASLGADGEIVSVPHEAPRRLARSGVRAIDIAFASRAVARLSLALAELQLVARFHGVLAPNKLMNDVREAFRNATATVGRRVLHEDFMTTFEDRSEL